MGNQKQEVILRRLICLFMLVILPLQGFAMQSSGMGAQMMNFAHEMEHALDVSHHHGDDGKVYYDQSDESDQHALDTSTFSYSVAILSTGSDWSATAPRLIEPLPIAFCVPDGIATVPIRPPSALG
jgi:hypothetical protein